MGRLVRAFVLAALLAPLAALAGPPPPGQVNSPPPPGLLGDGVRSVPEFDPAAVGIIATLVAGGGVLVASRRRKG